MALQELVLGFAAGVVFYHFLRNDIDKILGRSVPKPEPAKVGTENNEGSK